MLLALVAFAGIVKASDLNLLLSKKFENLPLNEVDDELDIDRSSLESRDEEDIHFRNEIAEGGRSVLDKIGGNESNSDYLEGKEGSSKVMNSCFKIKCMLLWIGVE